MVYLKVKKMTEPKFENPTFILNYAKSDPQTKQNHVL